MAQADQRADHRRHAADVVDADLRLARGVRREVDDGRARLAHRRQVARQLGVEGGVIEARAGKDHRRRAQLAKQPHV